MTEIESSGKDTIDHLIFNCLHNLRSVEDVRMNLPSEELY